ncbi:MAG TPA: START-like domain-containing protein [Bacteroidales bacterium]|nr:START-like domain-containing protein [Bacteroidales bacterium]
MKTKYELEYALNCSPKVLFTRLSTAEGLSEWFADQVEVRGDVFAFHWNRTQLNAKLSALKENKLVRFEWIGNGGKDSNYFEFRISKEDLTGGLALIITDFAETDEKEDSIYLWDTQVQDLKRILGVE